MLRSLPLRSLCVAGAAMMAACASAPAPDPASLVKSEADLPKANQITLCLSAADELMLNTDRSSDAYALLRNNVQSWLSELDQLAVDRDARRNLLYAGSFRFIDELKAAPNKSVRIQEILSACPKPSVMAGEG